MMKAVLKTLAISFGGGLALGAGMRLTQGPVKSRREPGVDLDPLLARLKSVESRIVRMETTAPASAAPAEPSPVVEKTLAAFESRLAAQFNDVQHLRGEIRSVDQRLVAMDAQLPVIIQSTVDVRFHEAERKLQQDFEEAQSRSMAAFVDTLQTRVVERISTLESNLAEQSNAIGKLRDTSLRTDENLQKMVAGIERLVDQSRAPQPPPSPVNIAPPHEPAPKVHPAEPATGQPEIGPHLETARVHAVDLEQPEKPSPEAPLFSEAAIGLHVPEDIPVLAHVPEMVHAGVTETAHSNGAGSEPKIAASNASEPVLPDEPAPHAEYEWVNRIGLELLAPRPKPRMGLRTPVLVGLVAVLMILIAGLLYTGILQRYFNSSAIPQTSTLASTAPSTDPAVPPQNSRERAAAQPGDLSAPMEQAREYQRRKDWINAEAAYRSALETNPANRDAALGLSDVLYQEQKYEESAAVLNKLSASKSQ
jgi:uncharacterized coiled-coil protein SlyX